MTEAATVELLRISAFSDGDTGGNPAGVCLSEKMPAEATMQQLAADLGYSETAFACRTEDSWRVRYFSPQAEVPFCGHATIALGAALASQHGDGLYDLVLNDASITVEGRRQASLFTAALQSPPTWSKQCPDELRSLILELFAYDSADLDNTIPPALIHAGADHVVIALNSRERLKAMCYPFDAVRSLMIDAGLVTIMFVFSERPRVFHSRNAFAYGGVVEDPATGAATAAFAGYLRDINWPHQGQIELVQGEDMGSTSRLIAEIADELGSSIRVSGTARFI